VRSPQEKKSLSYANDRRNVYGESSKASRKNIPRSKAKEIRRTRRETKQALHSGVGMPTEDQQVNRELAVLAVKPRQWRKVPDEPLGEYLAAKKKQPNARRVGRPRARR
jgi:hypothetical protein